MGLAHAPGCETQQGRLCSCGTEEMVEEFAGLPGQGIKLILDGDNCWPDLVGKKLHHIRAGLQIAALDHGTSGGRPSVAIRIDLPDGSTVIAETTLRLFISASKTLASRFDMDG